MAALDKITLLARHSAPIVLSAAREGGYTKVGERLEVLAQQVGFEKFDGKLLFDVCVRAGVLAEAALRQVR